MSRPSIVVIGGGTGNFNVLSGLKAHDVDLTAIVAMSDSGGSSGRLRDELGQLPPGDVRQCLVALADAEQSTVIRRLFTHRFTGGVGLNGHNVGNLLIAALTEITGGPERAIEAASRLLNIRGKVLPVTLSDTHLHAVLTNGTELATEGLIDARGTEAGVEIDYVFLKPVAYAFPPAVEAITRADLVVMAPGDLYTSLIPNLLVEGIPEAIHETRATVVYVANLMTKAGETDGFTCERFLSEVTRYLGSPDRLDTVVVNSTEFTDRVLGRYAQMGAAPVTYDTARLGKMASRVVEKDLVAEGVFVRHDPERLASVLLSLLPVPSRSRGAREGSAAGS